MSKLFKLKEWLTVPDAAKHLSIAFGEEVSEADVLRLALDGHLKLSVNFVNHAQARCGRVVNWMETKWSVLPSLFPTDKISRKPQPDGDPKLVLSCPPNLLKAIEETPDYHPDKFTAFPVGIRIDEAGRTLELEKNVISIDGIWDLPMIGAEQLDVEHAFQMMTGGPEITLTALDGAFVERASGEVCQLQESFDDNQYSPGSNASLEEIKTKIAIENLDKIDAEKLLNQHKEDRKKYLARRQENRNNDYYPAGGLPSDAVYVVRTEELRNFEQRISENDEAGKPLKTTERNTLLTIIAALCDYSAIVPAERGAASQIAKLTDEIGAPVTDDTIRKLLSKIPDALERRKK